MPSDSVSRYSVVVAILLFLGHGMPCLGDYDNLSPLFELDPVARRRVLEGNDVAFGSFDNEDTILAQPFLLGPYDTVDSVSILVASRDPMNFSTSLIAEIWSDSGNGTPALQIGSLGTIRKTGQFSTFDESPVSNLTPEETYHVVLRQDGFFDNEIVVVGDALGTEGAGGAGNALFMEPDRPWRTLLSAYGPPGDYIMMKVDTSLSMPLDGDFDRDGVLSSGDIDLLWAAVRQNAIDPKYDLNTDGSVDRQDGRIWIKDVRNSWIGDANLDGEFNSSDLVLVFQAREYEDAIVGNSSWGTGDWDADGEFTTSDLVAAFQDQGFEQGPRRAIASVPEPVGAGLLIPAALGIVVAIRKRDSRSHVRTMI